MQSGLLRRAGEIAQWVTVLAVCVCRPEFESSALTHLKSQWWQHYAWGWGFGSRSAEGGGLLVASLAPGNKVESHRGDVLLWLPGIA